MAQQLTAGLPPFLELPAGYVIRLTAIDPTTGNTVTGVVLSSVSLLVTNLTDSAAENLAAGPFMLVPGAQA